MADPKIIIRRSSTPNKVPTENQLSLGELAINTYDGKLYLEQDQTSTGLGVTVIAVNPWGVGVGSTSYNTYFTSGNVGLGLTNPTQRLDIDGGLRIRGALYDSNNVVGAAGSILISTGIGVSWTIPSAGGSGTQGAQGAPGAQGSVGSQGSQGSQGFQGNIGSIGAQGTPGSQGATGAQGSSGSQGSQGLTGAQGAQGPSGTGGGESYWSTSTLGIHTLSNVGVGTTNPTDALSVSGNVNVTGTITASKVFGAHPLTFPTGDYGLLGATQEDAFGISLLGIFDCLKEPSGTLSVIDLEQIIPQYDYGTL